MSTFPGPPASIHGARAVLVAAPLLTCGKVSPPSVDFSTKMLVVPVSKAPSCWNVKYTMLPWYEANHCLSSAGTLDETGFVVQLAPPFEETQFVMDPSQSEATSTL